MRIRLANDIIDSEMKDIVKPISPDRYPNRGGTARNSMLLKDVKYEFAALSLSLGVPREMSIVDIGNIPP